MFQGELVAIYIAANNGDDPHAVEAAEAVAGQGLVGDRYFLPARTQGRRKRSNAR